MTSTSTHPTGPETRAAILARAPELTPSQRVSLGLEFDQHGDSLVTHYSFPADGYVTVCGKVIGAGWRAVATADFPCRACASGRSWEAQTAADQPVARVHRERIAEWSNEDEPSPSWTIAAYDTGARHIVAAVLGTDSGHGFDTSTLEQDDRSGDGSQGSARTLCDRVEYGVTYAALDGPAADCLACVDSWAPDEVVANVHPSATAEDTRPDSRHIDGVARGVLPSTGDPVARELVAAALVGATDGATVAPTGLPYGGSGILVAIPEYGDRIPVGWTPETSILAREWVDRVAPHVTGPHPRPRYFGAWVDGGTLYLDIVESFPREDIAEAIAAGRARDQIAVWDAGRAEEIPTGGTGAIVA